jgi:UPF0271 protein
LKFLSDPNPSPSEPLSRSALAEKTLLKPKLKRALDINIDLGQNRDQAFWEQNEYKLLQKISSVNLPCLVHDGDPASLLQALEHAQRYHCAVGAHIAYPDPQHQGYNACAVSKTELKAWIWVQLGALQGLLQPSGVRLEHVRPHGLLYRHMSENPELALTVAEAVREIDPWLRLLTPLGPGLTALSKSSPLPVAAEFYLGKRYQRLSRQAVAEDTGAVETNTLVLDWDHWHEDLSMRAAADQARQLLKQHSITTHNGDTLTMPEIHSLHLSPSHKHVEPLATQLLDLVKQPLPLAVSAAHASGWVDKVDDRITMMPSAEDY